MTKLLLKTSIKNWWLITTEHSGLFSESEICWCCGNEYSPAKKRCKPSWIKLGHPCELMSTEGNCKTRSLNLRKFGHCNGKIKNKKWGLKMDKPKTKTFKSEEEKLEYFDKKLDELHLRKIALENSWKEELIQIVIGEKTEDENNEM